MARLFVGQDIHGEDKVYNNLKETYQIVILAKYQFFPDDKFTHNFFYYDPDNRISLGGKTRIITVELVKTKLIADKPVEEMTNAESWAVFIQYLTDERKRDKIIDIINQEEGIAVYHPKNKTGSRSNAPAPYTLPLAYHVRQGTLAKSGICYLCASF